MNVHAIWVNRVRWTIKMNEVCVWSSSKKDVAIRRKELLEAVSPPLLEHLCENAPAMVMDKASCVAVRDILGAAIGDLRPAMEAVAVLAAGPLVPGGEDGQVTHQRFQPQIFAVLSCCM